MDDGLPANNDNDASPAADSATMTTRRTPHPRRAIRRFARYGFIRIEAPAASAGTTAPPPGDFEAKEFAKLVLEFEKLHLEREKFAHTRWWQEDTLVNQRLTWLLTSQGVLFAAYVLASKSTDESKGVPQLPNLVATLPSLGVLVCLVITFGVIAAGVAQELLLDHYKRDDIELGVSRSTNAAGKMTGWLLPLCFIGAWGWLSEHKVTALLCTKLAPDRICPSRFEHGDLFLFLAAGVLVLLAARGILRLASDQPRRRVHVITRRMKRAVRRRLRRVFHRSGERVRANA